jgi:hypothetical protein
MPGTLSSRASEIEHNARRIALSTGQAECIRLMLSAVRFRKTAGDGQN